MHLIVFANPLENDFATSVNSRVMKGHLDSRGGRSVPKSRVSQKS